MKIIPTKIPDVLIFEPRVFADDRGFFYESFNQREFDAVVGNVTFKQDNHSLSRKNVVRGLHYQVQQAQGKLVRVTRGAVFDVAVDLRLGSKTYGEWVGVELSDSNQRQLWIPPGFAHGFLSLSGNTDFLYKASEFYAPEHERCIAWDDPTLNIQWPIHPSDAILSPKDAAGSRFNP
jgi:dTDP-4-dehydrorhamnose 3,5-epimerase